MTMPLRTMKNRGTHAQNPITLCQLKSQAFPDSPPRNNIIAFKCRNDHFFGSQRYRPLTTRNRKSKFEAPVIARPVGRPEPFCASQRCQSVTDRKNSFVPFDPSPSTAPVYGFTYTVRSRPNPASTG